MTVDLTRKVLLTPREAEAIMRLAAAVDDKADDERRALARIENQLRKLHAREVAT